METQTRQKTLQELYDSLPERAERVSGEIRYICARELEDTEQNRKDLGLIKKVYGHYIGKVECQGGQSEYWKAEDINLGIGKVEKTEPIYEVDILWSARNNPERKYSNHCIDGRPDGGRAYVKGLIYDLNLAMKTTEVTSLAGNYSILMAKAEAIGKWAHALKFLIQQNETYVSLWELNREQISSFPNSNSENSLIKGLEYAYKLKLGKREFRAVVKNILKQKERNEARYIPFYQEMWGSTFKPNPYAQDYLRKQTNWAKSLVNIIEELDGGKK